MEGTCGGGELDSGGNTREQEGAMFGMWWSNGAGVASCGFASMLGVPRVGPLARPVVGRSAAAAIAFEVAR